MKRWTKGAGLASANTERRCGIALALCFYAGTLLADLQLHLPVRCDPGKDCFIQNYYDHDGGAGWRDYRCGSLSYDGHTGTDFRLKDLAHMQAGVAVLAAAAGIVQGVRDGEADVSVRERPAIAGKAAGNGVRIRHDDGWETQYSHLRQGSVRVRPGQRVEAGEELGQIGLSGRTEFPHLDFTVRKDGRPVDPFNPEEQACGQSAKALWAPEVNTRLAYQPTAILGAGFADRPLTPKELQAALYVQKSLPAQSPAVVFHVETMGGQQGDEETMRIVRPDGSILVEGSGRVERNQAVRQRHIGKRRAEENWLPGDYIGHYALRRQGETVVETEVTLQIVPSPE